MKRQKAGYSMCAKSQPGQAHEGCTRLYKSMPSNSHNGNKEMAARIQKRHPSSA